MENLGLTSTQTEKVLQFQDLTGIEDISICRDALQRHQWDLEVAVQEQLNIREGRPSVYALESRPLTVTNDLVSQHYYSSAAPSYSENGVFGILRYLFYNLLFKLCYDTIFRIFQFTLRIVRPEPRRALTDPVGDVLSFVHSFEEKFGDIHPVFYQGTYKQALSDAKQELRFLLVYLHEDENVEAIAFCRNVLTNQAVITYINQHLFFWACSVNTAEGYHVSQELNCHTYPYSTVIVLKDNRMTIVGRLIGNQDAETFLRRLQCIIKEFDINLVQARADRMERSITQSLRAQQDEAYLESLRMDQEKARRREAEQQAILEEERRIEEEKMAEKMKLFELEQLKITSQSKIPPEPDVNDPVAIQIVFKMPSGQRIQRRFSLNDTIEAIYYFIFCHPQSPTSFEITTNFPKRLINCQPNNNQQHLETIQQAGLKNREVLFVHDLDS